MSKVISGVCDFVCLSVCLSVCLRVLCTPKEKRIELSTPNLVHIQSMAGFRHALTLGSKSHISNAESDLYVRCAMTCNAGMSESTGLPDINIDSLDISERDKSASPAECADDNASDDEKVSAARACTLVQHTVKLRAIDQYISLILIGNRIWRIDSYYIRAPTESDTGLTTSARNCVPSPSAAGGLWKSYHQILIIATCLIVMF